MLRIVLRILCQFSDFHLQYSTLKTQNRIVLYSTENRLLNWLNTLNEKVSTIVCECERDRDGTTVSRSCKTRKRRTKEGKAKLEKRS